MAPETTSLLLRGGRLGPAQEREGHDAVLIDRGVIRWIGRSDDAPAAARSIVLDGRRVVPGLTDAHAHLFMRAQEVLNLELGAATDSIDALLRRVAGAAAAARAGEWVIAADYNDLALRERRHPSRAELDAAAGDVPVLLRRTGGHLSVANSAALARAQFDVNTPDPPGGEIMRHDGALTGVLTEKAADIVAALAPPPSRARTADAIRRLADDCLRLGIVALVEAAVGFSNGFAQEWETWQALQAGGGLPLRMGFMLRIDPAEARRLKLAPSPVDPRWQVRTLKFFVDGIIGARTAALSEPYADGTGCGLLMDDPAELRAMAREAHADGWQLAAHVIGDRAIAHWLDALAAADAACPRTDARHRLEHFALSSDEAIAQARKLGAVVVPQYGFIPRMGEAFAAAVGPARAERLYPARSLRDAGLVVAGSSDHPIGPLSPFIGMAAAVSRATAGGRVLNGAEALTPAEALAIYSEGGATAMGHERWRGRLEVGHAADLAVLDCDVLTAPTAAVAGTRSVLTLVNGEIAWRDDCIPAP